MDVLLTSNPHWIRELANKEYHDISIMCGERTETLSSVLLASVSEIFHDMLIGASLFNENVTLILCDYSTNMIYSFLQLLTKGEVYFETFDSFIEFQKLVQTMKFRSNIIPIMNQNQKINNNACDVKKEEEVNSNLGPQVKIELEDDDEDDNMLKTSAKRNDNSKQCLKSHFRDKENRYQIAESKKECKDSNKMSVVVDEEQKRHLESLLDNPTELLKMLDSSDESEFENVNDEENKAPSEREKRQKKKSKVKVCKLCGFSVRGCFLFRVHLNEHVGNVAFQCKICQKVLDTPRKWYNHRFQMHKGKVICQICGESIEKNSIASHVKNMHDPALQEKLFKCSFCEKTFKIKGNMKEHEKIHKESKDHICDICGKSFLYAKDVEKHIAYVHERSKLPLKCEVCGQGFFHQYELNYHMNRHTGNKPFPCEYCDKKFFTSYNRLLHTRSMHLERKKIISCKQCGAEFHDKNNFYNHAVIHNDILPYVCCDCEERFKTPEACRKHLKKEHGKSKGLRKDLSDKDKVTLDEFCKHLGNAENK